MRKSTSKLYFMILAVILSLILSVTAVVAIDLGDILKVGGIAFLVDQYDSKIDNFINKVLGEREAQAKGATKVVPILSVGSGTYVGACQVVGIPSGVEKTKAVVSLEFNVGSFKANALVPVTTKSDVGNPTRQKGVGASAIIEFRI